MYIVNMDFGKNLLMKYGWREGKGLGKNNDGIVKPLKASLKFDNDGLGLDKATDFNNHWWERVYNEAANNLEVKNDTKVTVDVKIADALEISTNSYSSRKLKDLSGSQSYNNFLKSTTLTGCDEVDDPNRIDVNDIILPKYKILTDDELFAACGGRTAHKGARHGLKLSGKLSRVEQQEKELLAKLINPKASNKEDNEDWTEVSSKKHKKKKHKQVTEKNDDKLHQILHTTEYSISKSKKKRIRKRNMEEALSSCLDSIKMDDKNPESAATVNTSNSTKKFEKQQDEEHKEKNKKRKKKDRKERIIQTKEYIKDMISEWEEPVPKSHSNLNSQSVAIKKCKVKRSKKCLRKLNFSFEKLAVSDSQT